MEDIEALEISLAELKKSKDDLIMKFGQLHITNDDDAAAHAKINANREEKIIEMKEMVKQKEEEYSSSREKPFEKENVEQYKKAYDYAQDYLGEYNRMSLNERKRERGKWTYDSYGDQVPRPTYYMEQKDLYKKAIERAEAHNKRVDENIKARDELKAEIAALDEKEMALAKKCVGDNCGKEVTPEVREALEQDIKELEEKVLEEAKSLAEKIGAAGEKMLVDAGPKGEMGEKQEKVYNRLGDMQEKANKYSTAAYEFLVMVKEDMLKVEEEKKAANEAENVAAAKAALAAKKEAVRKYKELDKKIKQLKEDKKSASMKEKLDIIRKIAAATQAVEDLQLSSDDLLSSPEKMSEADDAAAELREQRLISGGRKSRRRRRRRTRKGAKKSKKRRRKRRTKKRKAAKKSRRRRRRR